MARISFGALSCGGGGELDDSSRLDVFEIARFPASELVSFVVGLRTYQHPINGNIQSKSLTKSGRGIF